MRTVRAWCVLLSTIALSLFAADKPEEKLKPALDVITPDALLAHIKVLSSDEFEGRSPGTKGEELSIKYISDQFRSIGLKPGNPDGSYFQEVPLAGIKSDPKMILAVAGKPPMELKYPVGKLAAKNWLAVLVALVVAVATSLARFTERPAARAAASTAETRRARII